MNIFVEFDDDAELHAFRSDELQVTDRPVSKRNDQAVSMETNDSGELRMGDWVEVIAEEDERYGDVGHIASVMNGAEGSYVFVDFDDGELSAFTENELQRLDIVREDVESGQPTADLPPAKASPDNGGAMKPSTTSRSEPATTESWQVHARRAWTALPTVGRIAVVGGPILLVLLLIGVLGLGDSEDESDRALATAEPEGSSDDWQRAVCRAGTFFNGTDVLRNSIGSSTCSSLNGVPIGIATYASDFALENDIAVYRGGRYARTTTSDGNTYVFVPLTGSAGQAVQSALAPLEQYGFVISPII